MPRGAFIPPQTSATSHAKPALCSLPVIPCQVVPWTVNLLAPLARLSTAHSTVTAFHVFLTMASIDVPVLPAGPEQVEPAATDAGGRSSQPVAGPPAQDTNVSTGSKRALRQQERKDYTEVAQTVATDSETDSEPAPKRARAAPGRQVRSCFVQGGGGCLEGISCIRPPYLLQAQ